MDGKLEGPLSRLFEVKLFTLSALICLFSVSRCGVGFFCASCAIIVVVDALKERRFSSVCGVFLSPSP